MAKNTARNHGERSANLLTEPCGTPTRASCQPHSSCAPAGADGVTCGTEHRAQTTKSKRNTCPHHGIRTPAENHAIQSEKPPSQMSPCSLLPQTGLKLAAKPYPRLPTSQKYPSHPCNSEPLAWSEIHLHIEKCGKFVPTASVH